MEKDMPDTGSSAEAPQAGDPEALCDTEDLLSVGSYLTDAPPPDSALRVKALTRDARAPMLDVSGIKLSLEESMDELCSMLLDQSVSPENHCFSFLYCDLGDGGLRRLLPSLSLRDPVGINLSWNKLSHDAMAHMGLLLNSESISTISALELDGNYIGAIGCQKLFANMRADLTMNKLSIQGNAIGDVGVLYICESLSSKGLKILELNVEGNGISDRGVLTLCRELNGSAGGGSIRSLNLANNAVGFLGARYLGEMLNNNTSLLSLDLRNSALGDVGIGHIAAGLKTNASLKALNVSDNDISFDGARTLFGAIAANSGLEALQLTRSVPRLAAIGTAGGHAVGEMLKTNRTLTSLDLYHGLIGAKGAESIAAGLRMNDTLKVINLGGNYIGPEATKSILNSLGQSQTTNTKYFKIRGPAEPMKFFRKQARRAGRQQPQGQEEASSSPSTVAAPDSAIGPTDIDLVAAESPPAEDAPRPAASA